MRKLTIFIVLSLILVGCSKPKQEYVKPEVNSVYYEIYVGSFYDSDNDTMGDLEGVRQKLDYIQKDLGATGIWLMPISPSPTYHKYDVTDYKAIDEQYGTMEDFDRLVKEMNERDMDLVLDLVLNHSSTKHPWFQKALSAHLNNKCDEVVECNFYHFSKDNPGGYTKLKDDLYYESVFWDQMPDLNLDDPVLRNEIKDIVKFWLDKGVKGFRLDATTHFHRENTDKNVEFLSWLNSEIKAIKPDAYIVGEAWTGDSIITSMYESQIDSFFNFSFAQHNGRIVKAVRNGNGMDLAKQVKTYQDTIKKNNPNAMDAVFLSNHDNDRIAGALANEQDMKMAANIYLLMPGNVFVYYGEEIGLKGSGKDENKRMSMPWSESNKEGIAFNPKDANYEIKTPVYVDKQMKDNKSLLNHYKNVISLRNKYPNISKSIVEPIDLGYDSVYAQKHNNVVVIHNLGEESITFDYEHKAIEKVYGEIRTKGNSITMNGRGTLILILE